MKILNISYYIPWPLDHGGSEAQFFFLKRFSAEHEVILLVPVTNAIGRKHVADLERQLPKAKIIGVECYPGGKFESIEVKLRLCLKLLQAVGFGVRNFFSSKRILYSSARVSLSVKVLHPDFVKAICIWLKKKHDIVQVDYLETISAVFLIPNDLPKVFVNHQVQCVFDSRIRLACAANEDNNHYLANWNRLYEGAMMRAYDGVVVFSEEDKAAIAAEYNCKNIFISPFPFPGQINPATISGIPDGYTLTFLGAESHIANRDGLEWFLNNVWNRIIENIPRVNLLVMGRWSSAFRKKYANIKGLQFMGFVDNLGQATKGSIMISPIRIGSGVRVKILTAMALGIPVISTTVGCEGIHAKDTGGIKIADTAEDFSKAVVDLLDNPQKAAAMA